MTAFESAIPAMSSAKENDAGDPNTDAKTTKDSLQPQQSYTYYHAGPLFTLAELHTNVLLSQAIHCLSYGRFKALLPQDIEPRGTVTPHAIRDKDIRALLSCDLALITYDGTELDSGTVVEYMIAKMADIPCVILRSDFRGAGDQAGGEPWNLMTSHWPRTRGVVVDALVEYRKAQSGSIRDPQESVKARNGVASIGMIDVVAQRCVEAMDEVLRTPARMPKELRSQVYQWIGLMAGHSEDDDVQDVKVMVNLLAAKEQKGMFRE
jgi:nucleoside 2-deoxyribosyltransferase